MDMKENRSYYRHHRNSKDHERQLQAIICQWNGHSRRNGQIFRKVQAPRTEQVRNRKYERPITSTKIKAE